MSDRNSVIPEREACEMVLCQKLHFAFPKVVNKPSGFFNNPSCRLCSRNTILWARAPQDAEVTLAQNLLGFWFYLLYLVSALLKMDTLATLALLNTRQVSQFFFDQEEFLWSLFSLTGKFLCYGEVRCRFCLNLRLEGSWSHFNYKLNMSITEH